MFYFYKEICILICIFDFQNYYCKHEYFHYEFIKIPLKFLILYRKKDCFKEQLVNY